MIKDHHYYDLVRVKASIRESIKDVNDFNETEQEIMQETLIRVNELKKFLESKIRTSSRPAKEDSAK